MNRSGPNPRNGFRNRWAKRMDRDESAVSAASMWALYMAGAVLLMGGSLGALVSVVFLIGAPRGDVLVRFIALAGLALSIAVLFLGRMLTDDYRIYPTSRGGGPER